MVKVTDLIGAVPEGNDAKITTLHTLRLLHKASNPIIYSRLYDISSTLLLPNSAFTSRPASLAFGTHLGVLKQARSLPLTKSPFEGLKVTPPAAFGFQPIARRNPFESLHESIRAAKLHAFKGFATPTVGFLNLPKLPPEQAECIKALDALEEGDDAPFWQFVEKQLGRPPDALVREVLDKYFLPDHEEIPSWVILRLLDHHRRRLNHRNPDRWHEWLAEQVYMRLRKNPRHRLMQVLTGYPEPPRERLKLELAQAVAAAEREGFFGGFFGNPRSWHNEFMIRDVEQQIVAANRLLRDTRNRQEHDDDKWDMVVSLEVISELEGEKFLATPDVEEELEEFASLEDERRRQRYKLSKGLPPKEQELIQFLLYVYDPVKHGPSPEAAAARELGRDHGTVRSQVYRMKQHFAS